MTQLAKGTLAAFYVTCVGYVEARIGPVQPTSTGS